MSKKEFLKRLKQSLGNLPSDERVKTLDYYSELIDDRIESGYSEEAAVLAMGDINRIASEITADARERGVEMKKNNTQLKTVLFIVLGVALGVLLIFACWNLAENSISNAMDKLSGKVDPIASEDIHDVKNEYALGDITNIDIDLTAYSLTVEVSDDDLIHLSYQDRDTSIVKVNAQKNSLSIEQTVKELKLFTFGKSKLLQMTLQLPRDFKGKLVSSLTAGHTNINFPEFTELNVSSTAGGLTARNLKAFDARFDSTAGHITVEDCAFDDKLSADVTAGKIELRNVNCVKLDLDTTMGEVSVDNVVADSAVIDTTTGSIKLKGLDAQSISLSATAGSIKGELAGSRDDYSVSSSVSLGSSNIKSGGSGTRSLNVECTTGSVSVRFADD